MEFLTVLAGLLSYAIHSLAMVKRLGEILLPLRSEIDGYPVVRFIISFILANEVIRSSFQQILIKRARSYRNVCVIARCASTIVDTMSGPPDGKFNSSMSSLPRPSNMLI